MRQLAVPPAGLETRDTADLEVCGTKSRLVPAAAFEKP
jgi:hypothetical protein